MPRKIPVHWRGENAVCQLSLNQVSGIVEPLGKSPNKLLKTIFSSPELHSTLIEICRKHLAWRDQEGPRLATASGNKQLREIAADARALSLRAGDVRENTRILQGKIGGLSTGPQFTLTLKLIAMASSLEAFTAIDTLEVDWAMLAEACETSLNARSGPVEDNSLNLTLQRLVCLYERASGKTFTHNPTDVHGNYSGELRSPCDLFVGAVMKLVDASLTVRLISTYLGKLKEGWSTEAKHAFCEKEQTIQTAEG